jgi:Transcriptional regulator
MARTGQPATRQVAAVQRAIAILGELADARGELGTNEIARRTGINVSTISRILATLAAGGLVDHVPSTGRYRIGAGIVQLAGAAELNIRSLARPHLEELARHLKKTTTLSVPGEHEAFTLDFAQSPLSVRSVAEVGRASVAHATAVGKVVLAYGGTVPGSGLKAYTERTIVDPAVLEIEVARVRDRGGRKRSVSGRRT